MERLVGVVQNYAWGSTTMLAELRGELATSEPEAELWLGAHPSAPSVLASGEALLDRIEVDAVGMLGDDVVERFGACLPFLLKLLAAGQPLSIQLHPSRDQAQRGFAREEAAGLDRLAPNRSFRDDNHKPELICALTPFEALVGFREASSTAELLTEVAPDVGHWLREQLEQRGPRGVVEMVLAPEMVELDGLDVMELSLELGEHARDYRGTRWRAEADLIARLDALHGGDPGVVVAALLNFVTLQPGQALFLGAGNLHAYVSGLAVEVMANSDNVLRGGLTPKHIDVPNLLDVLVPDTVTPEPVLVSPNGTYQTPAPDFTLTRHEALHDAAVSGPAIVVVIEGRATLTEGASSIELGPTEAAWVGFGQTIELRGDGLSFSASVDPAG